MRQWKNIHLPEMSVLSPPKYNVLVLAQHCFGLIFVKLHFFVMQLFNTVCILIMMVIMITYNTHRHKKTREHASSARGNFFKLRKLFTKITAII